MDGPKGHRGRKVGSEMTAIILPIQEGQGNSNTHAITQQIQHMLKLQQLKKAAADRGTRQK